MAFEGAQGGNSRYAYPHTDKKTADIVSLLGSGAVPGVGQKLASVLVSRFGDFTLEVLRGERGDDELLSVPGIGPAKLIKIRKSMERLAAQPQQQQAHTFCRSLGISDHMTKELWKLYGVELEPKLRANPYMLIDEFPRIFSFIKVDELARTQLGLPSASVQRAGYALKSALSKNAVSSGHCYQSRMLLLAEAQRSLYCVELPAPKALKLARTALERLIRDGVFYTESPPAGSLIPHDSSPASLPLALPLAPPASTAPPGARPITAQPPVLVFSQALAREEVAVATAVRKRLPSRPKQESGSRVGESEGDGAESAVGSDGAATQAATGLAGGHLPSAHLPSMAAPASDTAEVQRLADEAAPAAAAAEAGAAEASAAEAAAAEAAAAAGLAGALLPLSAGLAAEQAGVVLRCAEQSRRAAEPGGSALGRMLILTGGPGTGKTFTVREVVRQWRNQGRRVQLACPTARAAAVLSNAVGLPASTIHRLLEYNPQEKAFKRNQLEPLEADALVVDEASMLDVKLAARLFDALPDHCVLLVVGDDKQLPSVGPGAVLYDMLRAARVPRVALRQIHRQDPAGDIARNAALVSRGAPPVHLSHVTPRELASLHRQGGARPTGCVLVHAADAKQAADVICDGALRWLEAVGYDLNTELQVLSPQKKGDAGTHALNHRLKLRLNPGAARGGEYVNPGAGRGVEYDGGTPDQAKRPPAESGRLCVGDKVIQLTNDYDRAVFNGDVGVVSSVGHGRAGHSFTVRFSGRVAADGDKGPLELEYPHIALDRDVALSYALTVHKAQGSEYPVVVVPVLMQHRLMLYRNLLYTGLSRAKRLLVLVGSEEAIRTAVDNDSRQRRNTLLAERIDCDELAPPTVRHL